MSLLERTTTGMSVKVSVMYELLPLYHSCFDEHYICATSFTGVRRLRVIVLFLLRVPRSIDRQSVLKMWQRFNWIMSERSPCVSARRTWRSTHALPSCRCCVRACAVASTSCARRAASTNAAEHSRYAVRLCAHEVEGTTTDEGTRTKSSALRI